MTLEQVLVFHRIVQTGSFKAAAGELHKTQPAISFAIKKLEEELEVDLFDRSSYRPVLTAHGKAFLEKSQKIMQGMEELENLALSFRKDEEPEVSVSIDGIYTNPDVLKLFRSFSDRYQNTKLNLSFDILSEAESKVLSKQSQMGITPFVREKAAFEIVPITTVKMLPVMSRDLYRERGVNKQSQLMDIDQIVVSDKNGPKGTSFGLLDNGKKWRLQDTNFKREIILAGLGWGHLSELSVAREVKEKKLVVLDFEDIHPRTLDINLVRLKKTQLGPVAGRLWEELIAFHAKRS